MTRYPKYKNSSIDWIGEIPSHWELKKIKHKGKTLAGGTPATGNPDYWDGDIPWLNSGKVQNNIIVATDVDRCITQLGLNESATKMIKPNSVLVALTGATCANIGYLTFPSTANQSVVAIENDSTLNSKFLYHFLFSQREQILIEKTGGAQSGINEGDVKNLSICFPPIEEQTTIAHFLDEKTTQIVKLISNKQKLIELLKEERTAIINEAVSGKGKNWEKKKLKYVADVNSSKKNFDFEKDSDEEIIFLPMEKVSENGELNQDTLKKINEVSSGFTYFERGDVIVAKITPCFENGKGALLENLETDFGFGSTEFHTIRATNKIMKEFLFFLTKSDRFMQTGEAFMYGAGGQKRVPTNFIKDFEVSLPSIKEQTSIVKHIQTEIQRIDNTISKIEKEIELMNEYRTALISEVVTGKIDVRYFITQ